MPTAQELLDAAPIKKFIEANQNAKPRIVQAAEKLQGEVDGPLALQKLLPALASNELNVFAGVGWHGQKMRGTNALPRALNRETVADRNRTAENALDLSTAGSRLMALG